MAVFARPVVWAYDLPLFREAIAEEEQLEGLLAAIATQDEAIWVIEFNEQPVAFAWGRHEGHSIRLLRFYRSPCASSPEITRQLLARIEHDAAAQETQLIAAEQAVKGETAATLLQSGFRRHESLWIRALRRAGGCPSSTG